jgi:hypothetical protein
LSKELFKFFPKEKTQKVRKKGWSSKLCSKLFRKTQKVDDEREWKENGKRMEREWKENGKRMELKLKYYLV